MAATRVLLITEGTYPYHFGGVSTWCHSLFERLDTVEFSLFSIVDAPNRPLRFELPPNVTEFRSVPLWGVGGVADWRPGLAEAQRCGQAQVAEAAELVGAFVRLLLGTTSDDEGLADVVHALHRLFVATDFDAVMGSRAVWDAYVDAIEDVFPALARLHGYDIPVALSDLTEGMRYIRSWLGPLAHELPHVDVAHAAMAGMCTLVAIAVQRDQGAGFMLTEHGIYLRECYLADAADDGSLFLKLVRLRFALRMTELSYAFADQVSPCCDAHHRWELRIGAHPARVSTIYYGVDASIFRSNRQEPNPSPVVVWVGRIDPIKDVETLVSAAALVHEVRPDVEFRLYGAPLPGGEAYFERCLALRRALGVDDVVVFPGYTSSPQDAFDEADLVVLSSISEGFPYSVLEAMLCSRPVVATAVGGIAEQIGPCGRVVEPRNPEQLAAAVIELLDEPDALHQLGEQARQRAETLFSAANEREALLLAYERLNRVAPAEAQLVGVVASSGLEPPSEEQGLAGSLGPAPAPTVVAEDTDVTSTEHPCPWTEDDELEEAAPTARTSLVDRLVEVDNWWLARLEGSLVVEDDPPLHGSNAAEGDVELAAPPPGRGARAPKACGAHAPEACGAHAEEDGGAAGELGPTDELAEVLDELEARIPQPVDALEVTAVLESLGFTDAVAQRYGAADAFDLGEDALRELRERRPDVQPKPHAPPAIAPLRGRLRECAAFSLTAVPALVAIGAAQVLARGSGFSSASSWAMWLGILAGVAVTNGLLQGLTPRASLYVGCGNWHFARQLVRGFTKLAVPGVAALLVAIQVTATLAGWGTSGQRWLFAAGFGATALLWITSAGYVVAQRLRTVGVVMALCSGVAVAIHLALRAVIDVHALVGVALGYALVILLLVVGSRRIFAARCTEPAGVASLPPVSRLVPEALPYSLYGVLVMAILIVPHLVAAVALDSGPGGRSSPTFAVVEAVLNLGLVPLMLSTVLAQRTCMLLWIEMRRLQIDTLLGERDDFARSLDSFFRRRLARASVWLGAVYGVTLALVALVLEGGWFDRWVGRPDRAQVLTAAVVAALAYLALGRVIHIGTVAMTLRQPAPGVAAMAQGGAVAAVLGVATCAWLPGTFAALPLLGGATWAACSSQRRLRAVLRRADHVYVTAV